MNRSALYKQFTNLKIFKQRACWQEINDAENDFKKSDGSGKAFRVYQQK